MANYLTSPKLTFDRDGGRLIAVASDAVEVSDLARRATIRIEHANVRAAIGFADQIWVATEDALHRYTPTGSQIGDPAALPFAEQATLIAAPCGPPTGIWGDLALHSEGPGAQLVRTALPPMELALPVTHRHFLISAWRRLLLPSGAATGLQITGGAVLEGGAEAVVVLTTRELALLTLHDGLVTSRVTVPCGTMRLAKRRGILAVLTDPRTLVAIDLRTGALLGTMELARPTHDLAIDPDGGRIALRSDRVEVVGIDALLRWSCAVTQPVIRPSLVA